MLLGQKKAEALPERTWHLLAWLHSCRAALHCQYSLVVIEPQHGPVLLVGQPLALVVLSGLLTVHAACVW